MSEIITLNGDGDLEATDTCGACQHWHRMQHPDLSMQIGECRHGPIGVTYFPSGASATGYPRPAANTQACSLFRLRKGERRK